MATLCPTQYTQDIPGCSEAISFEFPAESVTPLTDYVIKIQYANGAQKLEEVESDYGGNIELINEDLWHNGTGVVTMQLFEPGGCNPISFENCGTDYDTMVLTFKNIITDDIAAVVPCPCAE